MLRMKDILAKTKNNSLYSLVFVNLFVIIQAIAFDWHYGTVLWIYYLQTVIIFLIALMSRRKSKDDSIVIILLIFYGFVLSAMTITSGESDFQVIKDFQNTQWLGVVASASIFFINHWYSYYLDKKQGIEVRSGHKILMRIITIHFSFFIAVASTVPLIVFMLLKTVIDAWSHQIQHKVK